MGRGRVGREKITHSKWRNFAVFALLIPKSVGGDRKQGVTVWGQPGVGIRGHSMAQSVSVRDGWWVETLANPEMMVVWGRR